MKNTKVSNRREIWRAIISARGKKEINKIIDGLNSCDALWLMDEIEKLPERAKKYLTIENKFSKV